MSSQTAGDVSLIQDEDTLRKMWQETDDFGAKKEIRSHMYKLREARLKDFYNTGEETISSSENRQQMTTTTRTNTSTTAVKGSELTTHADNLADHSFLSLKSKEIRDSESPTKDSYKITESRKINDQGWNIVESNESSKDGKAHTTSRIATTSGKQQLEGGELNYAAKSEQKASVYKDGDDKNFIKSVGASSQNVIKQEASGGDENSKFHSTSTTASSSSKFTTEQRFTTGDTVNYKPMNKQIVSSKDATFEDIHPSQTSQTVIRKVYSENIPNELKHPKYIDGNTKVTTETKTLPDGSTITTTRYETKGGTQYSSSSATTSKNISSNQQTSSNISSKSHSIRQDTTRGHSDNTNTSDVDTTVHDTFIDGAKSIKIIKNQDVLTSSSAQDSSKIVRSNVEVRNSDESNIRRMHDASLIGRETKNVKNVDIVKSSDISSHDTQTSVKMNAITDISTAYDNQQVVSNKFLDTERQHVVKTTAMSKNTDDFKPPENVDTEVRSITGHSRVVEQSPISKHEQPILCSVETIEVEFLKPNDIQRKPELPDEQPERRRPYGPGKSEWVEQVTPTEGQYDTTYRSDYVPRRISVEVSPTHDAFARSLRSISPDRISKTGSTRSLRTTSTTSLRNTNSPERYTDKAIRMSPSSCRTSSSPKSSKTPERYSSPEVTSKKTYDSPEKKTHKIKANTITRKEKLTSSETGVHSSTLTRKNKNIIEKPRSRSVSPTSTASEIEFIRHRSDLVTDLDVDVSNTKRVSEDTKLIRRHTEDFDQRPSYIEITATKKPMKVTDKSATSPLTDIGAKRKATSPVKESAKSKSPVKESPELSEKSKSKTTRKTDTYEERCKEILGIDTKGTNKVSKSKSGKKTFIIDDKNTQSLEKTKEPQIRKSPEKESREVYLVKSKINKQSPSVQEFPSQIRKSPTKEPLESYPEKPKSSKHASSIQEFPSQIRRSPEKEPLRPYPEKPKNTKQTHSVREFPSQIRKSTEKKVLEPYPEKPRSHKESPSVQEFPSQIRKSPEKEPLEPYLEKPKTTQQSPSIHEFPSQIKKSPIKEPLEQYTEKPKGAKQAPFVQEFPYQVRKSPEKESLEPYPEKPENTKQTHSVSEFPSQIRKSPEKKVLEPFPEKTRISKQSPSVQEFPSQIRKSEEKEPLEPYPEKPESTKHFPSIQEFPSQIRKSAEKEPQIKKSFREEPLEPSQVIKELPTKELLEPYPVQEKITKQTPSVQEFPSQTRKSPERELPEQTSNTETTNIRLEYFDRPLEKSPNKVSLDDLPSLKTDKVSLDDISSVKESKSRKSPDRVSLTDLECKSDKIAKSFITNEKLDSAITLTNVQKSTQILSDDNRITKKKVKKIKTYAKEKKPTSTQVESSTTTDEDEEEEKVEQQEIDIIKKYTRGDVNIINEDEIVETSETVKYKNEENDRITKKEKTKPSTKEIKVTVKHISQTKTVPVSVQTKTKPSPNEAMVEDFITVTKSQLLESVSKTPVEEPLQTKKFISTLCKDEEEDRITQRKMTLMEIEQDVTNISSGYNVLKPNKTVKKDSPDKRTPSVTKSSEKKSPSQTLIIKEKLDTSIKIRPDVNKTEIRVPSKKLTTAKKTNEDRKTYEAEYADQYNKISKDRKSDKQQASKILTTITVTPVKYTQIKKASNNRENINDVRKKAKNHVKINKTDDNIKKTTDNIVTMKTKQIDKKGPTIADKKPIKINEADIKQTHPVAKTFVQKTVEIQPARRHVVSTIINIKPKIKPETITKTIHKTTATKTITAPKSTKVTSKSAIPKQQKLTQNGHISTDDEVDLEIELIEVTEGKPKKTTPFSKANDFVHKKKKCITTKSILIENAVADEREIIVDLKRSKSSREGTPDRICPYPISTDKDSGVPRYPDRVTEPDDGTRHPKSKRIFDVPLTETEDVKEFSRITEVTDDLIKGTLTTETKTDECLLSVNEKVNKFLNTAEQITKKSMDMKPAPKIERPQLEVDDNLKEDECLLSVSDKVQKFISTAEQLATSSKETLQKAPKYKQPIDDTLDETKDVSTIGSIKTVKQLQNIKDTITSIDLKPEQCRTVETESEMNIKRSVSPEKRSPLREQKSPVTPERMSSDIYSKRTDEIIKIRNQSFEADSTPKISKRTSTEESKTVLSSTGRLRSTETIKKAKALFENIAKDDKQKDILNRPSVFKARQIKRSREELSEEKQSKDVRSTSQKKNITDKITHEEVKRELFPEHVSRKSKSSDYSPSREEVPHYMIPLDRSLREHKKVDKSEVDGEVVSLRSRDSSLDKDIPHYMLPLDRSLRERSPHKEHLKELEDIMARSTGTTHSDDVDTTPTKFGVTLRRTESGRETRRKPTAVHENKQTTDLEVEEIYDLAYLEKLLETIVGYDIRRRIRTQIRKIKQELEEKTIQISTSKHISPTRHSFEKIEETSQTRTDKRKQTDELAAHYETHATQVSKYQSSYTARRTSSELSTKQKSPSPGLKQDSRNESPKTPKSKSISPDRKMDNLKTDSAKTSSKILQTDLRKIKPVPKVVADVKPEWITQKTLRKVTETIVPVKKTVAAVTKTKHENISTKTTKSTDVITSSYGVGPTDENGIPLFGLKALRAQNKPEATKVQGTVIQSRYYSENGEEPVGEISVTKYSTDPKDLGTTHLSEEKGFASVTTTQKFGPKVTSSSKSTGTKNKRIEEGSEYKSSSKVTRRGSVKEISQKFIENAVETLKNERQSSYPKAGLILRTSSFKDAASSGTSSSREGSPVTQETHEKVVTTVKTSTSKDGKSFLTNKSRVTGVQDVISRMKTEEIQIEESTDDAEAKNLLNKFIGSQVLLSGMESHVSKPVMTSSEGSKRTTTKITTTTKTPEISKPTTITRTFTHPITPELLETVWDEQTLELLLEQSTDYEDRRIIRARLREVMAEQEACADLVEKASDEAATKESGHTVHETTTRTYSEGPVTATSQTTTRTISHQQTVKKPMSPFAKFRQLDKQNSINSPPSTPKTPTGGGPLFKFTDPTLNQSANTVKQRLLQWCQMKTKEYENIQLDNFSTSWADGMAFCALIHHFLPDAFDYKTLNPKNRRHNFTLAFQIAEEKAGIFPLLDVDDMVAIRKPDWKCVFTYVQSIYRRFKDED